MKICWMTELLRTFIPSQMETCWAQLSQLSAQLWPRGPMHQGEQNRKAGIVMVQSWNEEINSLEIICSFQDLFVLISSSAHKTISSSMSVAFTYTFKYRMHSMYNCAGVTVKSVLTVPNANPVVKEHIFCGRICWYWVQLSNSYRNNHCTDSCLHF